MRKVCLLCPTRIPTRHILCYSCYRMYKHQMHEAWFQALLDLQKVQERIDMRECYTIDSRSNVDLHGVLIEKDIKNKRPVGRPRTHWKLVDEILRMYDESVERELLYGEKRLSVRAIEKRMQGRVKFLTVWNIIRAHRKRIRV